MSLLGCLQQPSALTPTVPFSSPFSSHLSISSLLLIDSESLEQHVIFIWERLWEDLDSVEFLARLPRIRRVGVLGSLHQDLMILHHNYILN